ncbi:hypothetical protein EYF80_029768 [Liparis tanakae]|uniref:Uncharacterized protein n=1 Tax=Liparis tanakae TaxID=230148 RepID=A0A4Z2H3F6_9TELE|nr:hypothetical protein EYF80_029768 [Liparis tanakae]
MEGHGWRGKLALPTDAALPFSFIFSVTLRFNSLRTGSPPLNFSSRLLFLLVLISVHAPHFPFHIPVLEKILFLTRSNNEAPGRWYRWRCSSVASSRLAAVAHCCARRRIRRFMKLRDSFPAPTWSSSTERSVRKAAWLPKAENKKNAVTCEATERERTQTPTTDQRRAEPLHLAQVDEEGAVGTVNAVEGVAGNSSPERSLREGKTKGKRHVCNAERDQKGVQREIQGGRGRETHAERESKDVEDEKNGASSGPGDDTAAEESSRSLRRCGRVTTTVKAPSSGSEAKGPRGGNSFVESHLRSNKQQHLQTPSPRARSLSSELCCRGRVCRGVAPSLSPSRWTPVRGRSHMSSVFLCSADYFQQK